MKLQWAGAAYKEMLWRCATALTVPHFQKEMDKLKAFKKEAYEWLAKIPPKHWARSHFSGKLFDFTYIFNKALSLVVTCNT